MADRTVKVRLEAVTSGFQRSMTNAAKSMDGIEQQMDANSKAAERWKRVGQASTVAGAAIAGGLAYAAKQAADTEKAMLAMNAVFPDSTAQMEKAAKAAADVGLSQAEYAEGATLLGAQLKNLGATQSVATQHTQDLMNMAADMGAQFGDTGGAVTALSALLRGERDPIERYAIGIKETHIQAEIAATGATKLEATIALLNRQFENSGAAGAAIRNADTLSQQMQILRAHVNNAASDLGAELLPALASMAQFVGSAAKAFSSLPEPLRQTIAIVGALAAAILLLGPRLVALAPAAKAAAVGFKAFATSAITSARALNLLAVAGGPVTIAIAAITTAVSALAIHNSNAAAAGKELADTFDDLGNRTDATRQKMAEMLTFNFAASDWDQVPFTIEETITALETGGAAWEQYVARVQEYQNSVHSSNPFDETSNRAHALMSTIQHLARDYDAAGTAQQNLAASQQSADAASQQQAATYARLSNAINVLTNDLNQLVSMNLAAMGSEDALIGQKQRLTAAIEENGRSLVGANQKSAANRAALSDEISKIAAVSKARYDQVAALGDEAEANEAAAAAWQKHLPKLQQAAEEAGYSKKQFKGLLDEVLGIEGTDVKVKVTEKGVTTAKRNIEGLTEVITGANGETIEIPAKADTDGAVDDVNALDDAVDGLPDSHNTDITQSGAEEAKSRADDLRNSINSIPDSHNTHYTSTGSSKEVKRATGGYVSGPGTGTSDSIPAMLSNGEYVIRASAVKRLGLQRLGMINQGQLPKFANGGPVGGDGVKGYASGGKVTANEYWELIRRQRQMEEDRKREEIRRQEEAERQRKAAFEAAERAREKAERAQYNREKEAARKAHERKIKQIERNRKAERRRLEREAERARNIQSWIENRTKGNKGKYRYKDKYGNFYKGRLKGSDKKKYKQAQKTINALAEFDRKTQQKINNVGEFSFREFQFNAKQYQAGYVGSYKPTDYYDQDKATQKKIDNLDRAFGNYKKLADEKIAFMEGVSDNFQQKFKALGLFNPDAFKQATEALRAGAQNISKANRELAGKTGADRRNSLEDLAKARSDLAKQAEEAKKKEVTLSNIMAQAEEQNVTGAQFRNNIKALRARGLNNNMIDEIMSMGGEQGNAVMQELLKASSAQIARLNAIDAAQVWRGNDVGADLGTRFNAGIAAAGRQLNVAINASPVTLEVDGKTLATALIEYKRKTGINF